MKYRTYIDTIQNMIDCNDNHVIGRHLVEIEDSRPWMTTWHFGLADCHRVADLPELYSGDLIGWCEEQGIDRDTTFYQCQDEPLLDQSMWGDVGDFLKVDDFGPRRFAYVGRYYDYDSGKMLIGMAFTNRADSLLFDWAFG